MKQDALRRYIKRIAKDDKDMGQVPESAVYTLRTATELFVGEIGQLIASELLKKQKPLTGDSLKALLIASKSSTFTGVQPTLETLVLPRERKPSKRKAVVQKRSRPNVPSVEARSAVVAILASPPRATRPPPPSASRIEEDDDYDASD
ncbi:Aste57867_10265 [Aphanomyces stellatus]|uniref:Aste57867_10265 protein n=1 Tax=Aphanomyces stellatus TaxID=120398 RepID=A0A485KQX1_9STRA|nr:hypothetical protein As57867_010225 [Aphanomyces stellatus]VFT87140.1 Aste57867_10265 [Aphanomyces stellatus]